MLKLPEAIITLLEPFRPLFRQATWIKVQILLEGAILASGPRTVSTALHAMGLSQARDYALFHHVLNRAIWSPLQGSQVLLKLMLSYLDRGSGPLVFGIDETIERRRGAKIKARGIYRDAVRSSQSHFVKTSGLRWISLMWLTEIPWAQRVWALPFLTILAPSERFYETSGRCHKKITDWARQMIYQLRRWLPERAIVVVGDSSYAVLELLHACQRLTNPVTMITRLRLDAALYAPAPVYAGVGRPRKKGKRLATLATILHHPKTVWTSVTLTWYGGQQRLMEITSQTAVWYHTGKPPVPIRWVLLRDPQGRYQPVALLCTNLTYNPIQIINWFIQRWQIEVTFAQVRTHLGFETQRQWSDQAIIRTTPLLLGLFSWITLVAHLLQQSQAVSLRQSAWYIKLRPTFADALGWVRKQLWNSIATFCISSKDPDLVKIPQSLLDRLVEAVCYAT